MSPVVGYATLQVIPSLKGVHESIRRALGDGAVGGAADQAGRSLGGRMGAGLSSAVQSAGRVAMAGLETVALAGGVAASAALVKGWGRLTTIEDATTALTISLQDSGAAAGLLGDVLDVVSGTPFNLDEFAAGAQQLVGMGIEAEKVPGYLEAIGEAAATQGGRAQEMAGRLTTVFGQIAASGQVQLQDVWRISDTGVNALGILANSFGVTRDEMKDMISSGAVPAGEALDALAAGILEGTDGPAGATIALAGTMEALRGTMSGAVAGIEPAMARLGAAVIEPFSPAVVAGANGLVDAIDRLAEVAGDLAGRVAASDFVERLIDAAGDGPAVVDRLVDGLGELDGVATVLAGSLAGLATKGLGGLLGTIGVAVPGIGPLAGAIGAIVLSSDDARGALGDLAADLLPIFSDMAGSLEPFLDAVRDAAGDLIPALADVLVVAAEAAADLLAAAAPLAAALLDIAAPIVAGALGTIAGLLTDNEVLMQGLITAVTLWAGASAWGSIVGLLRTIETRAWGVVAAVGSSTITTHLGNIAGGFADVARNIAAVPDYDQRIATPVRNGLGRMQSGVAGLLGVVNPATVALAGLAFAFIKYESDQASARREAEAFQRTIDDLARAGVEGAERLERAFKEKLANSLAGVGDGWENIGENLADGLDAAGVSATELFDVISSSDVVTGEMVTFAAQLEAGAAGASEEFYSLQSAWRQAQIAAELLAAAEEDLGVNTDAVTAQGQALTDAMGTLGDETASAVDQFEAWRDVLNEVISAQIDTALTADEWALKLPELTMELAELGNSISGNSTEARLSRIALGEMAQEALRMAETIGNTEGPDAGRWALESYRQDLIETATQAGIAEDDIAALLDEFGLLAGSDPAVLQIQVAGAEAAERAVDAVREAMERLGATPGGFTISGPTPTIGWRWGGIHETARWGRIPAHVTQSPTILYGERETGGEAMIPRLGDKDRSKRILRQAADWYDLDVVDRLTRRRGDGAPRQVIINSTAADMSGVWADTDMALARLGL